ncbi:hypothetical protein HY501_02200 [Candidatus Woesearchaeota archaeon]|nr:hypothetical protein [Candidatus Woesearchaeota archaeon]
MIAKNELKPYLEALAEQLPNSVTRRLKRGSRVQKSWGLSYEIDDINIDKRLGDFPEGTVPYGPIHRSLKSSQGEIMAVFRGSSEAPFSRAYAAGVGECLEKAILVQLSAQRGRDAFLILGCLTEEDGLAGVHAYNVIFKDGQAFLVDTQNPLAKDPSGKITHAYIAPILGIEESYGDFVVPREWKQRRTYSIF